MTQIEPHSDGWFAIVDRVDRAFANGVRATIKCESAHDICTICGDHPLGDFEVLDSFVNERAIPSLRLCACCLEIRRGFGDQLRLLSQGAVTAVGDPLPDLLAGWLERRK